MSSSRIMLAVAALTPLRVVRSCSCRGDPQHRAPFPQYPATAKATAAGSAQATNTLPPFLPSACPEKRAYHCANHLLALLQERPHPAGHSSTLTVSHSCHWYSFASLIAGAAAASWPTTTRAGSTAAAAPPAPSTARSAQSPTPHKPRAPRPVSWPPSKPPQPPQPPAATPPPSRPQPPQPSQPPRPPPWQRRRARRQPPRPL